MIPIETFKIYMPKELMIPFETFTKVIPKEQMIKNNLCLKN